MPKPMVGVSSDLILSGGHRTFGAGEKYLLPIAAIGARPRLLPSLTGFESVDDLLDGLDGLLLTGALSNVEPHHYGKCADCPPYDPARDAVTLPLIRACLDRAIPLLAICRGHQELNVALGGSLHPQIHDEPGRFDHRTDYSTPLDVQYGPAHKVTFTENGLLARITGQREGMVNSLHAQAIDRPAERLAIEATAADGTIEAVRVMDSAAFALGLQWHPEWRYAEDSLSAAIFESFREALFTNP